MKIDREVVARQAAAAKPRRRVGVNALVASIHKLAPLRDWVTSESIALPPVPQFVTASDGSSGWTLWSLIAFARRDPQQRVLHLRPAWGVVQWQWPNGRVLRNTRLRELPEIHEYVQSTGADEAAWRLSMEADALAQRARFFEELTRFVSEPSRKDPAALLAGYQQVLPPAALDVYRRVVPGAATWLRPAGAAGARESRPQPSAPKAGEDSPSGPARPSGAAASAPAGERSPERGTPPAGRGAAAGSTGPEPAAAGPGPGATGSGAAGAPAQVRPGATGSPGPTGSAAPTGSAGPAASTGPAASPVRGSGATGPSLLKTRSTALNLRLSDARRLAEEFGLEGTTAELDRLRERMREPGMRVAVVGEFGRGKSTLVNQLLGAKVVPEGRHTPVPVVVGPGPEARLDLIYADGHREPRPAVPGSWEDVAELAAPGRPDERRLVEVRVRVPDPELSRLDVEFVDTPGVNAGRAAGTASAEETDAEVHGLVRRTVAGADAVLMVVSASAPLGLSETTFLEEEVIARHVPRITVVVSKLDTVDEEEREDIVDYLGGRVRRISGELGVLAGPHREDASAAAEVRACVERYATEGARRTMRVRQTTGQLLTLLQEMAEVGREGVAAARLDAQARRRSAEQAEIEIDSMTARWGMVRVELQKRRADTAEKFREHLRISQDDLVATLRYEVERTPEPRTWWERDLPYRLRRELTAMAKKYEAQLHSSVQADLAWLDARMKEHFGTGASVRPPKVEQLSTEFELNEAEELGLKDLKSRKLAWRIGPTGVAVLGMLLIPLTGGVSALPMGLGMAASAGGMVLGEVKSGSLTDQQRAQALKGLEPAVEQVLGTFSRDVAERLESLYAGVMEEAVRGQQAWRRDRQAALRQDGPQGPAWQDLVSRATAAAERVGELLDQD